ncbi:MAG: hypothetical protein ACR2H0_01150, partial [Candidatus Limnocylindrales bacterium]
MRLSDDRQPVCCRAADRSAAHLRAGNDTEPDDANGDNRTLSGRDAEPVSSRHTQGASGHADP